ncbi:hypothetical protein [Kitasatospora sp. NPDC002040]|uniref:outer membrane protein assembly factor BamB family protein n=1 Tax=Kitasatospora sp. NPDC002040 TaxID=3154661 RepID=UPI00331AB4B6
MSWKPLRALTRRSVLPAIAVLAVLGVGAAAHANRPVPFGDRLVKPGNADGVDASPVSAQTRAAGSLDLRVGPGLEAFDRSTGEHLWSYRREGATALHQALVGESAVVVWDDGMVTSVRPSDHEVRWHRAVPGLADWLHGSDAKEGTERTDAEKLAEEVRRAAAALQPVDGEETWVAVVTPALTMGFRDSDGDLRFNSRPLAGCSYDPLRAVHTSYAVLVPRSCTGTNSSGSPLPGGVTGFRLSARTFQIDTGPNVQLRRLDEQRIAIEDGPVLGTRTYDTKLAAPESACTTPFAALGCPAG